MKDPNGNDTRPLLVTPERAARELSLSRSTLYLMLRRGELRGIKIGAATRIPLAEVEGWIERQLVVRGFGDDAA